MGFSKELRRVAEPIWVQIFHHPFIKELMAGTLPLKKFHYYLIQDYLYMEGFGRAVALGLAKASESTTLKAISERIRTPIERPLHRKLMPLVHISENDLREACLSPTNLAYVSHIVKVASLGNLGVTAAALLPCPWTYHELGGLLGKIDHPVYGVWSSAYAEGWLNESVNVWRGFVDQAAMEGSQQDREAMEEAFLTSSRYEFLFWEMANIGECWPG